MIRVSGGQRHILPAALASSSSSSSAPTIITTATLTNPMPGMHGGGGGGEQGLSHHQKLLLANQKVAAAAREKQATAKYVDELCARLEKKELLLRKLVEENSKSVQKAQATERRNASLVRIGAPHCSGGLSLL